MHGLCFEYKSMSADALNSTNTALGSVVACVDYNAATGPFLGKQDMLNSYGAIDCKPNESIIIGVECDPAKLPLNELYVRGGAIPSGQDPKTYDMGVFNIATCGVQAANVNLGEIYVMYDVEFMLPVIQGLGQNDATTVISYAPGSLSAGQIYPYSSTNPSVNTSVLNSFDTIGIQVGLISGSGMCVAFPPTAAGGIFRIVIQWTGTAVPLVAGPGISPADRLTVFSDLESPPTATTTNRLMVSYTVRVPNQGDGLQLWDNAPFSQGHPGASWPRLRLVINTGVFPSSLTSITLTVVRLNPGLLATPFYTDPLNANLF